MFRKIVLSSLFSLSLICSIESSLALDLAQYSKPETVSRIFKDKEVINDLKQTLGKDYETFTNNFDVFGEPHVTPDGGVFIEGWLKDLYQENASAAVISPDGKIYAAWVVPESDVINYKSSEQGQPVNKDIQRWAERFKNMNFAAQINNNKDATKTEYFNTKAYAIKLTTVCSDNGECNDATYYGKRKKDGAAVTLHGKAIRAECSTSPCPIIGYKFKNASTTYMLSKADNTLTVIENNKILMNQKGDWSN
ncbi:hypothetical protein [Enterobacter roggenkampii]|uniref:hypothetical protein n=1 Tax=Enterobacter roggenkampii TaxID=1812935 RepID=UPI0007B386FD|nr:hypothetical protein [Enterobacter roggenkampii]SSW83611.1 Uncharacterised protein [Klebsiella pneumoniae]KZR41535.1 hypothetical protein A3467_04565 [Enterobacter roggenkampii]MBW9468053.1 hypothetical protein [Enterobacter roggenkampii]NHA23598.1 hypothetical protein [Enterobacter roggenkampii]HCM9478522.1 hypothetical protein [Enterobacter roggenkampii]